jgi:DNA-directed RNA polymerase II subunit RPB9
MALHSSNMLYPREDKVTNTLEYHCRTCQFAEAAPSSCIFRNNLAVDAGEIAGVTDDVGSDPTVGTPEFCMMCGESMDMPKWGICEGCIRMLEG